jgi:hypothetical protein
MSLSNYVIIFRLQNSYRSFCDRYTGVLTQNLFFTNLLIFTRPLKKICGFHGKLLFISNQHHNMEWARWIHLSLWYSFMKIFKIFYLPRLIPHRHFLKVSLGHCITLDFIVLLFIIRPEYCPKVFSSYLIRDFTLSVTGTFLWRWAP